MKKYIKPSLNVIQFEADNVLLAASNNPADQVLDDENVITDTSHIEARGLRNYSCWD